MTLRRDEKESLGLCQKFKLETVWVRVVFCSVVFCPPRFLLLFTNQKLQTRFILATQKSFIQFANQFYVA